jgi:hypothetical protein
VIGRNQKGHKMHFNRPHIAMAAVVLALGASAVPAAGNATGSSPRVRPNSDEQIFTTPAQPTHSAQPAAAAVQPNPDQQTPVGRSTREEPIVSTPAVIVRVSSASSGFDWGDAGIGAAGGLGLSLIALAGGLAVARHRARRTVSPAISH